MICDVDIHISAAMWARIYATAIENYRQGMEPDLAYWAAVDDKITPMPNLIVDSEEKGPNDIEELPEWDVAETSDSSCDCDRRDT